MTNINSPKATPTYNNDIKSFKNRLDILAKYLERLELTTDLDADNILENNTKDILTAINQAVWDVKKAMLSQAANSFFKKYIALSDSEENPAIVQEILDVFCSIVDSLDFAQGIELIRPLFVGNTISSIEAHIPRAALTETELKTLHNKLTQDLEAVFYEYFSFIRTVVFSENENILNILYRIKGETLSSNGAHHHDLSIKRRKVYAAVLVALSLTFAYQELSPLITDQPKHSIGQKLDGTEKLIKENSEAAAEKDFLKFLTENSERFGNIQEAQKFWDNTTPEEKEYLLKLR